MDSRRFGFEFIHSFVLKLDGGVYDFVHHFTEFDFVFGEDIVNREFENLFKRIFFVWVQVDLTKVAHHTTGHDITQWAECACEADLVEFDELLVIGLQVEPALLVHPLADQLNRRLCVLLLFLRQVDVINKHNT